MILICSLLNTHEFLQINVHWAALHCSFVKQQNSKIYEIMQKKKVNIQQQALYSFINT